MEKIKIVIGNIEKATRKDGTAVIGTSRNGRQWTLYRVNDKYSYFGYGELSFKEGDEIEFELTEQTNDRGYTNYLLSLPKRDIWKEIEELKKRMTMLEKPTEEPNMPNLPEEEIDDIPIIEE